MQAPLPFDAPTLLAQSELSVLPVRPSGPDPPNPLDPSALVPSDQRAPDRAFTPSPQRAPVFVRHPRARRYVIRVAADGAVRVTVPRWGSKREAEAFAARERAWIEKQQRRAEAERERRERERRTANDDQRTPDDGPADLQPAIVDERALRDRAKRELPRRLLELSARHGLTVSRVSIRNQRWRWGSCSRNGHICLNWRLIQMPDSIRDYVMIHELMHLKRMDHSPKFWKLVAQALPDFESARAWLRTFPRT
jgi:predicted metal-dependent hydrolase